jgi:metal transporter CNNM
MLREIFQTGFSRIPVYGAEGREDIIGMLFVKDLIFVDPEDNTPVKRFVEILGREFQVQQPLKSS